MSAKMGNDVNSQLEWSRNFTKYNGEERQPVERPQSELSGLCKCSEKQFC